MSDRRSVPALTRRRLLKTGSTTAAAGLAGCLGTEPEDPELEVLHDWISGPGEEGVNALTDGFEAAHPDVDTDFKPIAIGGDKTFEWVVRNRLEQDDPPSSFAARAGADLDRYEGHLGDAGNEALRDGALAEAHVDAARDLCRYEGRLVAVPLSVRRTNCLFYNVDVVEEASVDPDSLSTPADLMDALEQVAENTDATPMAHGLEGPTTTLQLISSVLLGQSGGDAYAAFVRGDGNEQSVRSAVETTERILSNHIPPDADSSGDHDASDKFVDGTAAFLHRGEWAADKFPIERFEFGTDWDVVPFPGTDGAFTMVLDAFVYPVGEGGSNPSPSFTETWLRYVGGREGQRLFNARRGTTPTRIDVPVDSFGPLATRTVEAFRDAEHRLPSLAHGMAVGPDRLSEAESVVEEHFDGPFDAAATGRGLIDAVRT